MKIPERVVVFDSKLRENFYPFSLTRPVFDLLLGSRTILEGIESRLGARVTDLIVPKYMEQVCKEFHPSLKVNEEIAEPCLAISSALHPRAEIITRLERAVAELGTNFVLVEDKEPVFCLFDYLRPEALAESDEAASGVMRKQFEETARTIQSPIIRYPWQLISANGQALEEDYSELRVENPSTKLRSKVNVQGEKVWISPEAIVEDFVTIDSSLGPVIVDKGAIILSFSRVSGPIYIGKGTIVNSALLTGPTSIGEECKLSGEIDSSIVMGYTNKAHAGFLGHSIVGSWVNLGALTTVSDLKNTYGKIKMKIGNTLINTGQLKVGCFIGDMCKTSIGSLIYSGKTIGVSSHVFGEVTEDVPSFTMFRRTTRQQSVELRIESAIETQRRMMQRRGQTMSSSFAEMIKSVHFATAKDRIAGNIPRDKFILN